MTSRFNRRDMLKAMGMITAGSAFGFKEAFASIPAKPVRFGPNPAHKKPGEPLTAIVIGAGNRGNVYAAYALKHPDELKIVGFAEPIPFRSERFKNQYKIKDENCFVTWEHVFQRERFADVIIITTPDDLHYGPAMAGLAQGYDAILEKPVAQTWQECNDILKQSKKYNNIVAICHVLRYTPYFRKMKEVIDSGILGEIVSFQHFEPIQHIHMSHSYVRGIWNNEKKSNPGLLAKSCHDLDILRWMIGKPCKYVSSFGSLKWFKAENAPKGAPMRCTDGCPVEKQCPYSALKIYYRDQTYLHHMDLPDVKDKRPHILQNLKEGQYGRCVYHCDNDIVDHQVVNMEFEDEITAAFSMEAFTNYHGRRTRVMGSMGDIVGDMEDMFVANFPKNKIERWNVKENADISSGHGGGDFGLVRDFIQAVSQRKPELLTSTIDASMESHLMGFQAEKSRHEKQVMKVTMNG